MILRILSLAISSLLIVHGEKLRCSSYLESHRISDVRLAENRTLCLRSLQTNTIYAISLKSAWIQWAVSEKRDFVLTEFRTNNCYCDCQRISSVCKREKLRRECPSCHPIVRLFPYAPGCDANSEATVCCTIQAIPYKNVSSLHLLNPIVFYKLQVSLWNETTSGRELVNEEEIELNGEGRHRLGIDKIYIEAHPLTHHGISEREVLFEVENKMIIPRMHTHKCVEAFLHTVNGPLLQDSECLPELSVDNCEEQRIAIENDERNRIDFSHGNSVTFSADQRHLFASVVRSVTLSIDDRQNPVVSVEDEARIEAMREPSIEVDKYSRRRFNAILDGAQGILHFTFITMSLSARYSVQYSVPSPSPYSLPVWLPLPAKIREDCTVCVNPIENNNTMLCMHAPYRVEKMREWNPLHTSIFIGSCDECHGGTSIIDRIAWTLGALVPVHSISKLLRGEALEWSDTQSLLFSALLIFLMLLVGVLIRKFVVPVFECCCCLLGPIPHTFLERISPPHRRKNRYSAVSPEKESTV